VGAFIAVAALAAEWALKSARRSVRWVWMVAIVATVALAAVAPLRNQTKIAIAIRVPELVNVVPVATPRMSLMERVLSNANSLKRSVADAINTPVHLAASLIARAPHSIESAIELSALASSLLALLALALTYLRFARARLKWPRAKLHGETVRIAPDVGPAVMGFAPPEIVVPQWVLSRSDHEQRLLLVHEGAHVRANDPALLLVACLAVAVMPWNAALWFMWSRLRLAVELDCDRRVLQSGVETPSYGLLLVELSGLHSSAGSNNSIFAMPAFAGRASHLERRLLAMTARPGKFNVLRRFGALSVVAFSLVAACESKMPTSAELSQMDAKKVAEKLDKAGVQTEFTVNGKHVTASEAKAIPAERIDGIAIAMSDKARAKSVVNIRLKEFDVVGGAPKSASGKQFLALSLHDSAGNTRIIADTIVFKPIGGNDSIVFAKAFGKDTAGRGTSFLIKSASRPANDSMSDVDKAPQGKTGAEKTASSRGPIIIVDGVRMGEVEQEQPLTESAHTAIRLKSTNAADRTIVILNGEEVTNARMMALNPDTIATIEVLKGDAARKLYGDRAVNGVIIIKTKH
ncbi:MAG: M56 family metallopeptidase, partial [Gemmatimonadaceae bacterium]